MADVSPCTAIVLFDTPTNSHPRVRSAAYTFIVELRLYGSSESGLQTVWVSLCSSIQRFIQRKYRKGARDLRTLKSFLARPFHNEMRLRRISWSLLSWSWMAFLLHRCRSNQKTQLLPVRVAMLCQPEQGSCGGVVSAKLPVGYVTVTISLEKQFGVTVKL